MTNEMRAWFDYPLERKNTHCIKWDMLEGFGSDDVLPMWVADMDFRIPQTVSDALCERVRHGAFGYDRGDPARQAAIARWMRERHGLTVDTGWILNSAGVVDSLSACVAAFSKPGDRILINTPLYGPFFSAIKSQDRVIAECPMLREDGWKMDYEKIEAELKAGGKMFLLCNPHNPVGRMWTKEELTELYLLCKRYGALIVSDEIHSDFVRKGHTHTPILNVSCDCIQLISATKSFNLAALRHSQALCPDPEKRQKLAGELGRRGASATNLMGQLAQQAAYETGGEWMDALNEYLDESRDMLEAFFREKLPHLKLSRSEGTYLLWLDVSSLGIPAEQVEKELARRCHIGFNGGLGFGEQGRGFIRINIATPHDNIRLAMERMEKGLAK